MANNPRALRPSLISIKDVLTFYANSKKDTVFCLQVGANDGKNNDPVFKYFNSYGWKGLLIEPQVDVFENGLKKTYVHRPDLILENVALGTTEGSLPFYRIAISKARWATGLSSFDLKSLKSHIDSGYVGRKALEEGVSVPHDKNKMIETIHVPTVRVDTLLKKYSIKKVDVLCVDTEGYDFEILKLFNFSEIKPDIILYESKNLKDSDYIASKDLLTKNGYKLFWEKGDTLALRNELPLLLRARFYIKSFLKKI